MSLAAENPETTRTRIVRLDEVKHRTGESRSSIYRLDKKGILRRAKQLDGCHTAGWLEESVDAYIESRRPDTVDLPEGVEAGQAKPSKLPVLIRPDVGPGHASAGMRPAKIAKPGRNSGDLQATTMMIMGNRVYLHVPTGRLLLEIGKAPEFPAGINIVGAEEEMEAAASGSVGSRGRDAPRASRFREHHVAV